MQTAERAGVLVSGATGLVGRRLVEALVERSHPVRTLSRSAGGARPGIEAIQWDGIDPGESAFEGIDSVVHLSGEPLFGGLPTRARLERARRSRIDSTRRIVERMAALPSGRRPARFVCASAVGIYGERAAESLDEGVDLGSGFLADLCRDWEAEAERASQLGIRVVSLRIGVVLSALGGALALMRVPFGLGIGGRLGSGEQYFPWIQLDDLVNATLFCLGAEAPGAALEGPVNAVAPTAVRNVDLTRALGKLLGRPTVLPVPAFALRALLGALAGELLESRRVVPARLLEAGFEFVHPTLETALAAELGRAAARSRPTAGP